MKLLFNWRHITVFAVIRTDSSLATSLDQKNIRSKFMFGVSWKGHTEMCIFEGIMNAEMYTNTLAQCLVPFIQRVYLDGHRFMQDNEP